MPSERISNINALCVIIIIWRRLNLSLSTPANGSMKRIGICERNTAVESCARESVMRNTSQPVAAC